MQKPGMQEANMKKQSSGHFAAECKAAPEGISLTMQYQCKYTVLSSLSIQTEGKNVFLNEYNLLNLLSMLNVEFHL